MISYTATWPLDEYGLKEVVRKVLGVPVLSIEIVPHLSKYMYVHCCPRIAVTSLVPELWSFKNCLLVTEFFLGTISGTSKAAFTQ